MTCGLEAYRGRKELLGSTHMDTLMTRNNYGPVAFVVRGFSMFREVFVS